MKDFMPRRGRRTFRFLNLFTAEIPRRAKANKDHFIPFSLFAGLVTLCRVTPKTNHTEIYWKRELLSVPQKHY